MALGAAIGVAACGGGGDVFRGETDRGDGGSGGETDGGPSYSGYSLSTISATECERRRANLVNGELPPCTVFEAIGGFSRCDAPGRRDVDSDLALAALGYLELSEICGATGTPPCFTFTFCEIPLADDACLRNEPYAGTPGYCYIDPEQGVGDAELVSTCPPNEERRFRFVDPSGNTPAEGAIAMIGCGVTELDEE